ncbi:sigma-54-dependent Fis family transcriptional regulator [Aquariibacter albus]|uniref:Sigma 54-interacting transcriptional regulator n=1 Tax=Aquariibacter albus TaxID=2759899 RepID=A0A839HU60_9BURK|nr:sigma 54-interacting transcriptional regulator [Aquariibacter albus]MBB1161594.1 sigma 54-interacting transcriptional regulator [Aquariibacter albus]
MSSIPPNASALSASRRQRELLQQRPIAASLALDGSHLHSIEESHQRCAALGLRRIESPDYSPLGRSDLRLVRERNQRLYVHAAPIMELLFEQIVRTQSLVLLTDAQGTILHSIGDDEFVDRASRVALQPGVNWSECAKGTNAIGTALIDESPTLVHADEHFMHANHFLTCSAAPILDPRGNILGVLDVSSDYHGYHQHTMALVKMSARMIENHWLNEDFRHAMRLHFHSRPEFIGTLMEGIVAVGRDGKILGANRSALDLLQMSGAAVRMHSVTSLFGTPVGAVVDAFRSPVAGPLRLLLPNGQPVHVQARCNWPTWHGGWQGGKDLGEAVEPVDEVAPEGLPAPERNGQASDAVVLQETALRAARGIGETLPPGAEVPGEEARSSPEGSESPVRSAGRGRAAADSGVPVANLRALQTGDPQMEAVIGKVRRVLDRDIPILILGETGSGKEVLARAIHQDSARARQPFVAVNCASIPETLIESELFGYADGAFTGARRKGAVGKIAQAHGGTLFLDEIGDMPLALQARLLRVLQERQVTPLGSSKSIEVDVTVISATHRNLREMIEAQSFREDLYYRLNGLAVKLPPLRERSDLLALARLLLQREKGGQRVPELAPTVVDLMTRYPWPGNLRQMGNVLRTAVVMAGDEPMITLDHLSDDFIEDAQRSPRTPAAASATGTRPAGAPLDPAPAGGAGEPMAAAGLSGVEPSPALGVPGEGESGTLEAMELQVIRQALEAAGGNISVASKRLGISRNTIYRKLRWRNGSAA